MKNYLTKYCGKIAIVILVVTLWWISGEEKSSALPASDNTLKSLWIQSENSNYEAKLKLADYYLKKGAFKQVLPLLRDCSTQSKNNFNKKIIEKTARAVNGMRSTSATIKNLIKLKHKSLADESLLLQLYLLKNNKKKAADQLYLLATMNSSSSFIEFLAKSAEQCLTIEESLPFLIRFTQSELEKPYPLHYPFLKAANVLVNSSKNKNDDSKAREAISVLESYLSSYSILQDFLYPNTDRLFTNGYLEVCERLKIIKSSTLKNKTDTLTENLDTLKNSPNALAVKPNIDSTQSNDLIDKIVRKIIVCGSEQEINSLTWKFMDLHYNKLTALEHQTLAIIFKKSNFTDLYLYEINQALTTELTPEEVNRLSLFLYPKQNKLQTISLWQSNTYCTLAKFYKQDGRLLKSLKACKQALIENPANYIATTIIEELAQLPSIAIKANKALKEINKIHNNVKLLSLKAGSENLILDFPKMYSAAHKAFGYAPSDINALNTYVRACIHKGMSERAVDACLTSIGHGAGDKVWRLLAKTAVNTGLTAETRVKVKDIVFNHFPVNINCLLGYLEICDTNQSIYNFLEYCKKELEKEPSEKTILLSTIAAKASLKIGNREEAISFTTSVLPMISPADSAFSQITSLANALNLNKKLAYFLEQQGNTIIGTESYKYYVEAARAASRGNINEYALSYYGQAIEKAELLPELENEFLSFGKTSPGFPFFMQGLLEKTCSHYEFYGLMGKYYFQHGHLNNTKAFLKLAVNSLPHRQDLQLLQFRASLLPDSKKKYNQAKLSTQTRSSTVSDFYLPNLNSNCNVANYTGIIRSALKTQNKKLLKNILAQWTMSPSSQLRKATFTIAHISNLEKEHRNIIKKLETASPYALWLPMMRAKYASQKISNKALNILEKGLIRAKQCEAVFHTEGLPLTLVTEYFAEVIKTREYERGLETFQSLLTGKVRDTNIRKLYEKLCILTPDKDRLIKSLNESMQYFPPLSKEALDRVEELAIELSSANLLQAYLYELPPSSELSADMAINHLYLRWYSTMLNETTENTLILRELLRRASFTGKRALPLLKRLDEEKRCIQLINRLLLRHGERNKPYLLLEKAQMLSKENSIKEATKCYKKIIKTMSASDVSSLARIKLIELITKEELFTEENNTLVSNVLPLDLTTKELVTTGKYFLKSGTLSKLTKVLRRLKYNEILKFEDTDLVSNFLKQIAESDKVKPQHTILKRQVALTAKTLTQPLITPHITKQLTKICKKMETEYLQRILSYSKKGSSRARGISLYVESSQQSLSQLVRLKPPVRDIYGNNLAKAAQIHLARVLLNEGYIDKAKDMANSAIKGGHKLGPDEPGSVWLEADRLLYVITKPDLYFLNKS